MDEDYQLDLTQVSAMAIGVVNAFGIGPVSFTITDVDLLPAQAITPVAVNVTGKTLSINDHAFIPAGIFGGFALIYRSATDPAPSVVSLPSRVLRFVMFMTSITIKTLTFRTAFSLFSRSYRKNTLNSTSLSAKKP